MRPLTAALGLTVTAVALAATTPATPATPPDDGWTQLFDGKTLKGWKVPPDTNKGAFKAVKPVETGGAVTGYVGTDKGGKEVAIWTVKDGTVVGAGPASHLFSESGEYDNFHYKVEAKINDKGNSGQYFRCEYGGGFPKGYEAQINATHGDPVKTGSIYPNAGFGLDKFRKDICVLNTAPHKADEFFTQEVIADGADITILVNGKQAVKWTDPDHRFKKGHFALQGHDPGTVVTFKSVAVKPIKK